MCSRIAHTPLLPQPHWNLTTLCNKQLNNQHKIQTEFQPQAHKPLDSLSPLLLFLDGGGLLVLAPNK